MAATESNLGFVDVEASLKEIAALRDRRITEKRDLHNLNNRLEVVLNSSEDRDEFIKLLTQQRDGARQDVNEQNARWEQKLDDVVAKWETEIGTLKAYKIQSIQERDTLNARNASLEQRFHETEAKLADAIDARGKLQQELEVMKSRLKGQKQKFSLQLSKKKEESAQLKQRLAQVEGSFEQRTQDLKQKLTEQMNTAIENNEMRNVMERDTTLNDLRKQWNNQEHEHKEAMKNTNGQNADLKGQLVGLRAQSKDAQAFAKAANDRAERAEQRMEALEVEHNKLLEAYRAQKKVYGDAYHRKELQFNELMHEKVKLVQEIAMYRKLVTRAETYEHLSPSPLRKRQRPNPQVDWLSSGSFSNGSLSRMDTDESSNLNGLTFGGGDVSGGYLTIWNRTQKTMMLVGWDIRNSKGARLRLDLARAELPQGDQIKVYLHGEPRDGQDVKWGDGWNYQKFADETFELVSPDNEVVSTLPLNRQTFGYSDETTDCHIM